MSVALELLDIGDGSLDDVLNTFHDRKWSDGLPIVPPTRKRVAEMLGATALSAETQLGEFPPRWRPTTVGQVAVNAVMAGCLPKYFPTVLASVKAILEPSFSLYSLQATTNPAGVMLIVNGPVAERLEINSGTNLFGQGWRANATIGRAVRLCMINIGGGIPGVGDLATLGNPNKYGSCIAENVSASPWEPYHVELGHEPETSTVTAVAGVAPQNVIVSSAKAEDILTVIAGAIRSDGSNCMRELEQAVVVIGPQHANQLARAGFDKQKVRDYLFEASRYPADILPEHDLGAARAWKKGCFVEVGGRTMLNVTRSADDLRIVVAGGIQGPHTAIVQTFNDTKIVTAVIDE